MANGFSTINTGLSALQAFQTATQVIGQNISNADTDGYSRQEVQLKARVAPAQIRAGLTTIPQSGDGVLVGAIRRYRDAFADQRFRTSNEAIGRLGVTADTLERVEQALGDPSDTGLSSQIDAFFHAWQDVANTPESSAARSALLEASRSLASTFQQLNTNLTTEQNTANTLVRQRVQEVNDTATQIADLNAKIAGQIGMGMQPNELLDQRDQMLDKLSHDIGASYTTLANGMVRVTLGGKDLVSADPNAGSQVTPLSLQPRTNGYVDVVWSDDPLNPTPIANLGGEIGGALALRDTALQQRVDGLNTLAGGIIAQVNAVHQTGFGLNQATGLDFFTGADATNMSVNAALIADPRSIGASSSIAGLPGDNSVALQITGLQSAQSLTGGTQTFNSYWNSFVADLGIETKRARGSQTAQQTIQTVITNQRLSESGVSLDEEAANLVRFQRSFEAASHLISVADDMIGRIVNDMGQVGR